MRLWLREAGLALGLLVACGAGMAMPGAMVVAAEQANRLPSDNPVLGDPEAIKKGRRLFNTWCTQCHGGKADGVSRFGKYAADLRKFKKGYSEFVGIVAAGIPENQMPPWYKVLDGDQIAQVGSYLETLAIEGANWRDHN